MYYDVIIVGAGQCGLYAAKQVAQRGLKYLVLERGYVGQQWDARLNGMTLFTSRKQSALPGLSLSGAEDGYPSSKEISQYLQEYVRHFALNVLEHKAVKAVRNWAMSYQVELEDGMTLHAKTIINATGTNQQALIPEIAKGLGPSVVQMQAEQVDLEQLEFGSRLLIVGDGFSGRQLAAKLSHHCQVTLAGSNAKDLPPSRLLGKDLFWWLDKFGVLTASPESWSGGLLQQRNPIPVRNCRNAFLKRLGVSLAPIVVGCDDVSVLFANQQRERYDAVIWATGYQDQTAWLKIEECVSEQGFIHEEGVTPSPGLYIVGRKWFSCLASGLIMGVERDVDCVLDALDDYLAQVEASDEMAFEWAIE